MAKESVDPTKVFGANPANFNLSRMDYPEEFVSDVLQDIFQGSALAPTNERPTVVDIGAGTGKLGSMFVRLGCNTTFVEPNPKMLQFLRNSFGGNPQARIIQATANDTGLPDNCADVIVIGDAAHWIDLDSLPELSRILKPGGQIASFARFWSLESPVTDQLHQSLLKECEDYRTSPNQFIRDIHNFRKRLGRHLINVESGAWRGYGFIQSYSKEELTNYFRGISSTSGLLEQDEALFRKKVIDPLWEVASRNDLLTTDSKLKVPYEIHVLYGAPRKRIEKDNPGSTIARFVAMAVCGAMQNCFYTLITDFHTDLHALLCG
jgi:SAM-dependent methyltransferase